METSSNNETGLMANAQRLILVYDKDEMILVPRGIAHKYKEVSISDLLRYSEFRGKKHRIGKEKNGETYFYFEGDK